jgi:hypothetical protein
MSTDSLPPERKQPDSSIEAINRVISILLSSGVDADRVKLYALHQYLKYDSINASIYEEAIRIFKQPTNQPQLQDLTQTTEAVVSATLTATQICKILTARSTEITYRLSGQKVNRALEKMGFHTCDYRGIWHLTELGKTYGELVQRGSRQGKTYWQVRWMPTVLDHLAPLFKVIY